MLLWIDYLLISLPGILVTSWAQARILRSYSEGARIQAGSGLTGAEVAEVVMRTGGVSAVAIEPATGELCDHYDAGRRVLRLSPGILEGRSLTAFGVAAHEAGHAIQHAAGDRGRFVRNLVVPLAGLGSQVCWILVAAGLWLGMERLIVLGIVLFSGLLVFQLINVPVELDASRRAHERLLAAGLVSGEEDRILARVRNAAAWTAVAATLTGVLALLDGFVPLRSLRGRRPL
jgi:Zn-dependent membrane protease YugP